MKEAKNDLVNFCFIWYTCADVSNRARFFFNAYQTWNTINLGKKAITYS